MQHEDIYLRTRLKKMFKDSVFWLNMEQSLRQFSKENDLELFENSNFNIIRMRKWLYLGKRHKKSFEKEES